MVKRFQEQNGLQQDGQVGPLTGTQIWHSTQNLISFAGNYTTPWGVPLSNCYQVLPTTN